MSGALRLFLALLVAVSHLVGSRYVEHLGFYAVRTFFVLSGFVITSALNEVYAHDGVRFWANRLLRLVPPYLLVCLATGLAIKAYPQEAALFMPRWAFPMTADAVAQNLVIAPLAFGDLGFRFIEPAWSVAVEILMYVVLFAGVARSAAGARTGFALGIALHLVWLVEGAPFDVRYFSPAAALLSFSAGASAYFWRQGRGRPYPARYIIIVLALWLANVLAEIMPAVRGYTGAGGFYVNVLFATLLVPALPDVAVRPALRRLDAWLGGLSYPVFLSQWLGGFLAILMAPGLPLRGWGLLAAALPVILALAAALAAANERYVEPLRRGVRSGKGFEATPQAAQAVAPARATARTPS